MWLLLAKSLFTQGSISKPLQWNLPSFPSFKFMWYMLEKPYASKNNKQPAVAALAHQSTQATASNGKTSGNERELPDRQTCTIRHAPCQPHAFKRHSASTHPAYISEESETETGNQVAANESRKSRTSWVRSAWGLLPRESCRSSGECP